MHDPVSIRVEMARRDIKVAQLARMTGISRQTIAHILDGGNTTLKTLSKIAAALEVNTAIFLAQVSSKHDNPNPAA